jgi:hypothetical protein
MGRGLGELQRLRSECPYIVYIVGEDVQEGQKKHLKQAREAELTAITAKRKHSRVGQPERRTVCGGGGKAGQRKREAPDLQQ